MHFTNGISYQPNLIFDSSIYPYYRLANTVFEAQDGPLAGLANMAYCMKYYTN